MHTAGALSAYRLAAVTRSELANDEDINPPHMIRSTVSSRRCSCATMGAPVIPSVSGCWCPGCPLAVPVAGVGR